VRRQCMMSDVMMSDFFTCISLISR